MNFTHLRWLDLYSALHPSIMIAVALVLESRAGVAAAGSARFVAGSAVTLPRARFYVRPPDRRHQTTENEVQNVLIFSYLLRYRFEALNESAMAAAAARRRDRRRKRRPLLYLGLAPVHCLHCILILSHAAPGESSAGLTSR